MMDRDIAAEEDANARHDADRDDDAQDGLTGTAERVIDTLISPLTPGRGGDDDAAAQREENDAEQRPT